MRGSRGHILGRRGEWGCPGRPSHAGCVKVIDESSNTKMGRRDVAPQCLSVGWLSPVGGGGLLEPRSHSPTENSSLAVPGAATTAQGLEKLLTCLCMLQALLRHSPAPGTAASGRPSLGPSAQDRWAARWAGARGGAPGLVSLIELKCVQARGHVRPHQDPGPSSSVCAQPGSCPQ